ncbi:MAG: flagellar biosynthesis protein FlhF, partial [Lachnospiraceae bacterium]|nr:flagellar biosynthesis protein FlhF [Lachnospiraceae bacterium]
MIIRKFVAKTENEATAAAKKELGEGMVIMNVRYVKPKGFLSFLKKKQVELTAAKEDDEEPIRQIRKIAQAQVEA